MTDPVDNPLEYEENKRGNVSNTPGLGVKLQMNRLKRKEITSSVIISK